MTDTEKQANAAEADFGILVIPRPRYAHPAEWWAHVWFDDVARLTTRDVLITPARLLRFPIRLELGELIPLLRLAGYGTPLDAAETTPHPPSPAAFAFANEKAGETSA